MFYFTYLFYPFLGTTDHLVEFQSLVYRFVKPTGNGRSEKSDDGNLYAITYEKGVGLEVWLPVFFLYHIGTQDRTAYFTNPFVIDCMSWFYIVVSYCLGIVPHIVYHSCSNVLICSHHIVGPVTGGLSLQDVTIVNQQQVLAILIA